MKTRTMKSFCGAMLLLFICGNLNAQNPSNRTKIPVNSMLDGAFRNLKTTAHNPQSATSPYFKVKGEVKPRYQLDSLVLTPASAYGANEMYMPKAKIECKYDSLGRMILFYASQSNDSTLVMKFSYKHVYSYGSNYSIKKWYMEGSNGSVSLYNQTKTIYDQNNRIQLVTEGTDTVNSENYLTKTEYIYENNLLSTINILSLNSVPSVSKTQYYYDALGRDTAEVTLNNSAGIGTLTAYQKKTYSYDLNNDMTHSETNYFLKTNSNPDTKSDYIYNNSHDCVSYTEISSNSSYNPPIKYISSYNKSIMMSDINYGYTFSDFPYTFKSQLKQMDLYLLNGSDSLRMGTYTLYYSEAKKSTAITNTLQDNNQIVKYNATSKTIGLQNAEPGNSNQLQLYSLSGKLMLNKPISTSVSVEELGNGLYIYKIITAGKTVAGKILIQ